MFLMENFQIFWLNFGRQVDFCTRGDKILAKYSPVMFNDQNLISKLLMSDVRTTELSDRSPSAGARL